MEIEVDDLIALHAAVQAMERVVDLKPELRIELAEHIARLRELLLRAWIRRMR